MIDRILRSTVGLCAFTLLCYTAAGALYLWSL